MSNIFLVKEYAPRKIRENENPEETPPPFDHHRILRNLRTSHESLDLSLLRFLTDDFSPYLITEFTVAPCSQTLRVILENGLSE